jgi:phosphatidylserine/phosphatidylglycerophosphate/cardiolipin synthase-like enzyme
VAELRAIRARLLVDAEHYTELVSGELRRAEVSVWIATANLKDLRVEAPIGTRARAAGRYVSLLEELAGLGARGVEVRILHGGPPSRAARQVLAALGGRERHLAVRQCPRVHLKLVCIDGRMLYLGSANFTGAGLGAKGGGRRNFELGLLTDDDVFLDRAQAHFDAVWSGRECGSCQLRRECPAPLDLAAASASPPAGARSLRAGARGRASSCRR